MSTSRVRTSFAEAGFFFQAEESIRDADVTGVQTCALPIYHSRLRVSNLFRFMEETVISDAEKNGYGIWKMVKHGYTYAISRIKLRLHHTPLWGEKLNISTWTKGYYKNKVTLKDYLIQDAMGNSIAQGKSSWLLVNLKTRKAEDPTLSPLDRKSVV